MFSDKLKAQYAGLAERQAAKKARLAQSADATTPDAPKKPYSFSDASPEQAATSPASWDKQSANFTSASFSEIYFFMWKVFAAGLAFAAPFVIIYLIVMNSH